MKKSIGFIGGGRITRIIIQAFDNYKTEFNSVTVYDHDLNILTTLKDKFETIEITSSVSEFGKPDIVFIALHPPVVMETLELMREQIKPGCILISLAPKITIEQIALKFPGIKSIVRLIPNASSIINEGYNPVCFENDISGYTKQNILQLLRVLGHTFEVKEEKLESYAIMSAMLPTYFWFQMKELIFIGSKIGLDEEESQNAVRDSLIAGIKTYFYSGLNSNEVIDLIPVKPISEHENQINEFYREKLLPLYEKIKP